MLKWIAVIMMPLAIVASLGAPAAASFQQPDLARIIFFHLPCAILCAVFLGIGAWHSFRFLATRDERQDIKAASAMEMGSWLAILTMLTGILFSKVQWGAWWQWDPRQTSFLIVTLLFLAYFALRASLDEDRRPRFCAAYALVSVLPALFLIFVFPRLPHVSQESFHPSQTIAQGQLDLAYRSVLYFCFAAVAVMCFWLYRDRVRAATLLYNESSINDGSLEVGGSSAADTGLTRPVAVRNSD
ncbi:MAG: cytochrome c biogenesis protein CcsA [Fimbriimonadaceae bacterium]